MRHTAPRRRIDWLYWLCVALFVATLLLVMTYGATHAHGGQVLTVSSSRQPIRRLRVDRTAVRIARAHGRAAAGFPLRQAIRHGAEAGAYVAGTAYRVSGLIPNPNGILANILFRR